MNSGIVQSSAKIILLDRALARYGPETKATRAQLQRALAGGIETVWPMEKTGVPALTAFERANGMELVQDKLRELTPQTDAQRQALAQAQQIVGDLSQTRWLLIEQGQNELPLPLLLVLVFWLTLLFVSFGLFAPCNATALTVLLVGAGAVSVAIFLVIEPPLLPLSFPKPALPKPSLPGTVETSASLPLFCMSRLRSAAM